MADRARWIAISGLAIVATAVAWLSLRSCSDDPVSSSPSKPLPARIVTTGPAKPPAVEPVPQSGVRLEGQVIDEADRPVAGAYVKILARDGRTTVSDAAGSFVFDGLSPNRYTLMAATDTVVSLPTMARLSDQSEPVIIHVVAAGTVVVRVIQAEGGAAVVGAKVADISGRNVTIDADGVATLRGVGPDYTELTVTATGYAPARESLRIGFDSFAPAPTKRTIKLRRGASVSGTVVGPDAKPVADAHVYFAGAGTLRLDAYADASGAWTLDAVAAGKYSLTAASETYARAQPVALSVDGATPRTGIVIRVDVGAQLSGTVLDAAGKLAPGAEVELVRGTWSSQQTTDAKGTFAFLGTPAGHFEISARRGTEAARVSKVELVDKQRVEVSLQLEDSSIAGRVVNEAGDPIAGVHVVATLKGSQERMVADDITDSKGAFDLGGVPPGNYELRARRQDDPTYDHKQLSTAKSGDRSVKLVIDDGTVITGRVLLAGRPMPYFAVVISEPGQMHWRQAFPNKVRAIDGRFAQRNVDPGLRDIVIAGPGFARTVIADVDVKKNRVTDLGDISVDRGLRFQGRVLDSAGTPVAGATVDIEQMAPVRIGDAEGLVSAIQGDGSAVTDAAGNFVIEGIPPTVHDPRFGPRPTNRIAARHPDRGAAPQRDLPAVDATIDLVLLATGGIDGEVVGAAKYDWIVARPTGAQGQSERVDLQRDGTFKFDKLPAGEHELVPVRNGSRGFRPPSVRVTVVANQRVRASIALPETITITIRVNQKCEGVTMLTAGTTPPTPKDRLAFEWCYGKDVVEIADVVPGDYRVCAVKECAAIIVKPTPARQTFDLPKP